MCVPRYPKAVPVRDPATGQLRFNDSEAAAFRAITAQDFVAG